MSMTVQTAMVRLSRQVPQAELDIDQALISLSSLLTTMVTARRDTETAGSSSHAAVQQVTRAIDGLVTASTEMARAHGQLQKIAVEKGIGDLQECPKKASAEDLYRVAA